ncbi:metallophosphoesterase [Natronobiforma cellulositropha]|uniref:metallophosphoesterase n=1 Tax=Natronobiforma cellulositropha TaxID=1679076 RepID=UPI0021D6104F|nr:metallophosphoesterase [Natronobiforma cellulositropha]
MTAGTAVDLPFTPLERAVSVPGADALVLADIHFGRGAVSRVEAPLDDDSDVLERLADALTRVEPATVVVAGDLLHSFSWLPPGVERSLSRLEATVAAAGARLQVTPGNHDTMLEGCYDGEQSAAYRLADGETVVCHGHERPSLEGVRYIVGHDHPALSVDGRKRPCFLYGPDAYRGADVLVLPAFTRLAAGATVNGMYGRDFQSPLVTDPDAFYPGVWDEAAESVRWFPPLGRCRGLL